MWSSNKSLPMSLLTKGKNMAQNKEAKNQQNSLKKPQKESLNATTSEALTYLAVELFYPAQGSSLAVTQSA
jgi:hypothetical protein